MRKIVQTAAVPMLAAGLLATPAVAQLATAAYSGKDWIADCTSEKPWNRIECTRYANGLAYGLGIWQAVSRNTAKVCIPEGVKNVGLVWTGVKYINKRPEDADGDAGALLYLAFREAWPCNAAGALGSAPSLQPKTQHK
jgi:Rap1a immunity proteins